MNLFEQYSMQAWRDTAKLAAQYAAERIPNSPASGELRRAANGENEELLLGVAFAMDFELRRVIG